MAEFTLNCAKRESVGKNKVNRLRAEKLIPAVVYTRGEESINIQIEESELLKVYRQAGTSNIVDLMIDGEKHAAIFKEVQKHPFKNQFIHADLQGVRADEKLRINIPIILDGRDEIRVQPSVLMQMLNEIEIESLPANIPNEIVIDVRDMQIGDNILVQDLDIYNSEDLDVLTNGEDLVASLSEPREEVIEDLEDEEISADVPTVDETEAEETEESDEE